MMPNWRRALGFVGRHLDKLMAIDVMSQSAETLRGLDQKLAIRQIQVQERLRWLDADERPLSISFVSHDRRALAKSILARPAPWSDVSLPSFDIPGMITDEEKRYYVYLAGFYSGQGAVIELGPWLGCSTAYIAAGLSRNPAFKDRTLLVYDDFVWRSSWMDRHYQGPDRPADRDSFRRLFDRFTEPFKERLSVSARKIADYDGNQSLTPLAWTGEKIELCFIDCGRNIEANEAWYRLLSSFFIPNRTLLVLQDWQTHKDVPLQWYNQMKQFTDSKDAALELVHELAKGSVATFLYKGPIA